MDFRLSHWSDDMLRMTGCIMTVLGNSLTKPIFNLIIKCFNYVLSFDFYKHKVPFCIHESYLRKNTPSKRPSHLPRLKHIVTTPLSLKLEVARHYQPFCLNAIDITQVTPILLLYWKIYINKQKELKISKMHCSLELKNHALFLEINKFWISWEIGMKKMHIHKFIWKEWFI